MVVVFEQSTDSINTILSPECNSNGSSIENCSFSFKENEGSKILASNCLATSDNSKIDSGVVETTT